MKRLFEFLNDCGFSYLLSDYQKICQYLKISGFISILGISSQ